MCTKCKVEKPLDEFSFRYKARGIKLSQCKTCMKENNRRHYLSNSEDYKERSAKRTADNVAWFTEFKKDLKCNRCGFDHPAAIQFHHIDPSLKSYEVGLMVRNGYSIGLIQKEIEKCEILCANCHMIHHHG